MKKIFWFFLLFCMGLFFSSCAGLREFADIFGYAEPPAVITPEAQRLFLAVNKINREMKTFKGTGRINLNGKNGEVISADIAWVAENRNKIYIAVLGVLGQPIAGLATDGECVYFASYAERKFYKKCSDNIDLKSFISIPIKIKDIALLLSGRAPVCDFALASEAFTEAGGPVLVLTDKNFKTAEKIYFDNELKKIIQIDMFDSGNLLYRVLFEGVKFVKEYKIPSKLIISNESGDNFKIDINRYWADEPVSQSVFVLKPPE